MRGRSGQVEDEAYWKKLKRLAEKQGRSVEDIQKIREDKETKRRNARRHGTNIESTGRDIATGEVTSRTDKLGTIRYLKDLKTGKVEEFDETGKPLPPKEEIPPTGLETIREEIGPDEEVSEVRGEVGLTEEEQALADKKQAELEAFEEKSFGERFGSGVLGKDPRLPDQLGFPLPIAGVGGMGRFQSAEGRLKDLTKVAFDKTKTIDEIFDAIKTERNTLTNQLNIIGKKTDVSKLGADKAATASRFKTNSKSNKETVSLLQKSGWLKTAGILVPLIGSYPFAGFIREEALQTLGFAVNTARESGDVELEQAVLDQQEELLTLTNWRNLIGIVPIGNVANELWNFFKAARKKWEVDKSDFERRREGRLTPEEERFEPFREKAIRENERFG